MNFSNDCKTVLFCFVLFPNQPIALVWLALHYSKPSQEYPKQGSRYRLTDAQVRTREEAGYLHSFSGFGNQWWKCQRIKKDIKVTWINWSFRTFKSAWFSGLFLFLNETINIYIYIYKVPSTVMAIYWGLLHILLFYSMCGLHCLNLWYYLWTLNLH